MPEVVQPRAETPVIPEPPAGVTQVIRDKVMPLIVSWKKRLSRSNDEFMHGYQKGLERSSEQLNFLLGMLEQWTREPQAYESRVETKDGGVKVMLRRSLGRAEPSEKETEGLQEDLKERYVKEGRSKKAAEEVARQRVEIFKTDKDPTPSPHFLVLWANPPFAERFFPGQPKLLVFTETVEEVMHDPPKREPRRGIALVQGPDGVEGHGLSFEAKEGALVPDVIESKQTITPEELGLLIAFVEEKGPNAS